MIRTAQRRFAPTVFGITRNSDRHQIGIGDRLRRNTQMNDGGFLQNLKAGAKEGTDQITAKMFELLIAMAAMDVGKDLELDHPENPKGDNPDVIVTIGGVRWAFTTRLKENIDA
jgi:hypothetical protein